MASDKVLHLTDATFKDEIAKSEIPIVVDFWAEWCGPCRMVGPTIDALADELDGKIKFCKVNVDECPETAGEYSVMSIPTFIVFKGGAVAGQFSGALPKDQFKKRVLDLA